MKYFKREVNIGDKIKIKSTTTTIKAGSIVEVLGFLNNDPDKIICKGLLPGGWINSHKLDCKAKVIKECYYVNIMDIIKQHDLILNIIKSQNIDPIHLFCCNLSDTKVSNEDVILQKNDSISLELQGYGHYYISEAFIKDTPNKIHKIYIKIESVEDKKKMIKDAFSATITAEMVQDFEEIFESYFKSLSETILKYNNGDTSISAVQFGVFDTKFLTKRLQHVVNKSGIDLLIKFSSKNFNCVYKVIIGLGLCYFDVESEKGNEIVKFPHINYHYHNVTNTLIDIQKIKNEKASNTPDFTSNYISGDPFMFVSPSNSKKITK